MRRLTRVVIAAVTAAGFGLSACTGGVGDAGGYPTKPVEMIVPFAAGGATDTAARALAPAMAEKLGVPVVVVNRAGGGGVVGTAEVAADKADGHTILYAPTGVLTQAFTTKEAAFSFDDLTPVIGTATVSAVIATAADSNLTSLADLQRVSDIKYATNGVGTFDHIDAIVVLKALGVGGTAVPFNGGAPALEAVLGKHVHFYVSVDLASVIAQTKAGKLRPLAVLTADGNRVGSLPDVPSVQELDLGVTSGDLFLATTGVAVPTRTDAARVNVLKAAVEAASRSERFQTWLQQNHFQGASGEIAQNWYGNAAKQAPQIAELLKSMGIGG